MSERFMKDFNGEKVFSLEYDKETLRDMVLEKQERIDKAIEYINEHLEATEYGEIILTHTFDKHNLKELKDILGSDKDEN